MPGKYGCNMQNDFEKRLERIKAKNGDVEYPTPQFEKPRPARPDPKGPSRMSIWMRYLLIGGTLAVLLPSALLLGAITFTQPRNNDILAEVNTSLISWEVVKGIFSSKTLDAQSEQSDLALKLTTGTSSEEEAEAHSANDDEKMVHLSHDAVNLDAPKADVRRTYPDDKTAAD